VLLLVQAHLALLLLAQLAHTPAALLLPPLLQLVLLVQPELQASQRQPLPLVLLPHAQQVHTQRAVEALAHCQVLVDPLRMDRLLQALQCL
jgi:hypothetical protein